MKEDLRTIFLDGAMVRRKNTRINFREHEGDLIIMFEKFANEKANIPACSHECIRGKIKKTIIKLSSESMIDLVKAYIAYNSQKRNNLTDKTTIK